MPPAGQSLEADDVLGLQIDQRLIIRAHIAFVDGARQVALDQIALLGARVHVGVEKTRSRFGLLVLGAVERDVRPAQDLDFASPVLR